MSKFRVEPDNAFRRKRMQRNLVWIVITISSPLFLVLILLFIPRTSNLQTAIHLAIYAVCTGIFLIAARLGIERRDLDTVYLLTEEELIRRRSGWPDDRIKLSEIGGVAYTRRCIVVKSKDNFRKIAIPKRVDGFANLLSKLKESYPTIPQP